ncbi:hypothetical protein THIOM_002677 [Candidatus Thiomargarita nelsonii]|uniref:Uncharacterized protein n=1 Tax=Candidatus Thiomargarita nelsonii TaxID=1003181 RepID=A0A176S0F8_9GAMM|nr:hypothetical protein THIOM_002677 [Candidatus Thiomargarita nelsonii]
MANINFWLTLIVYYFLIIDFKRKIIIFGSGQPFFFHDCPNFLVSSNDYIYIGGAITFLDVFAHCRLLWGESSSPVGIC